MKNWPFLFLFASGLACAQTLNDPTQPPAAFAAPTGASAPISSEGGLRLQSVMLPRGGRPVAVIGGQSVRLGEKLGTARLVAVNEKEAVLKGPEGVQRLFLTPGVEKTGTRVETPSGRSAKKKDKR